MHIPVLLKESIELLQISDCDRVIDATFGGGGHTRAILESNQNCTVIGVDRDSAAIDRAAIISKQYNNRFSFINSNFSKISTILKNDEKKFDAILFDFGVSSFQIDDPHRGFSFQHDGALDMRMSPSNKDGDSISALDVVSTYSEEELADIIYTYGDEANSRKIAANIVKKRKEFKIDTTFKLKQIIDEAFNNKKQSKIENATKTFQAIRIYINDELCEIDAVLTSITEILNHGARIVTISFHSLEDRIVKLWQKNNKDIIIPINKKVIKPSRDEIKNNVRSRSAVLRGFVYE